MRYCNSLLLVRSLTVLLGILLLNDYHLLVKVLVHFWTSLRYVFDASQLSSTTTTSHQSSFGWIDVDLLSPPAFRDWLAEALRLSELLARPQHKCAKPVRIGNELFGFLVCYDKQFVENNTMMMSEAFVLSGDVNDDGSFVKSLRTKRWTMFIPQNYAPLDQLGDVDVEVNYLLRLQDFEDWDLDSIIDGIADRHFDSAFFNFYTPFISSTSENGGTDQLLEVPKLLSRVLPHLHSKQLQIIVKIDKQNASNVTLEWYRLLYRLFFVYNFALLNAEASGNCGRALDHCKYRLSFVHFENHAYEVPVFGLGSPLEERNRLIHFMRTVDLHRNCTTFVNVTNDIFDLPPVCLDSNSIQNNCTAIYIRYRDVSSMDLMKSFGGGCQLCFFSPLQLKIDFHPLVRVYRYGLSPLANQSIRVPGEFARTEWEMLSLLELVDKCTQRQTIDAFILDLEGGEWDIFDALLNSPNQLLRFKQISIRLRLWIGEENENYRRFYYHLIRLKSIGFQTIFYRSKHPSIHYILFEKHLTH